jgi:hypothetical protein
VLRRPDVRVLVRETGGQYLGVQLLGWDVRQVAPRVVRRAEADGARAFLGRHGKEIAAVLQTMLQLGQERLVGPRDVARVERDGAREVASEGGAHRNRKAGQAARRGLQHGSAYLRAVDKWRKGARERGRVHVGAQNAREEGGPGRVFVPVRQHASRELGQDLGLVGIDADSRVGAYLESDGRGSRSGSLTCRNKEKSAGDVRASVLSHQLEREAAPPREGREQVGGHGADFHHGHVRSELGAPVPERGQREQARQQERAVPHDPLGVVPRPERARVALEHGVGRMVEHACPKAARLALDRHGVEQVGVRAHGLEQRALEKQVVFVAEAGERNPAQTVGIVGDLLVRAQRLGPLGFERLGQVNWLDLGLGFGFGFCVVYTLFVCADFTFMHLVTN